MENDAAFDLGAALDPNTDVWDAYDKHLAPREETRWSDYPKAFAAGLADVGAGVAANIQYADEGNEEGWAAAARRAFTSLGDYAREGLSPEYRRRESLPFVAEPGQATIFDEPTMGAMVSALGPKLTSSLGSFAAFLGAGALGTAVGGPVGARIGMGAAGSTIGAGSVLKDIYAESDKISDEQLAKVPMVQKLLDEGKSIKEARREWNQARIGALPLFNAALGLVASQVGVGGAVARAGAAKPAGRLATGAKAGLEEGAFESAESLAEEFNKQWASISGGLQADFAGSRLINAPIEGMVLGTALGAGTGVVTGGGRVETKPPPAQAPGRTPAILETGTLEPDPAQAAALTPEVTPTAPTAAPAPAPAPVAEAPAPAPVAAPAPAPAPPRAEREPTVLETGRTLEEQVRDLEDNIRPVALFPIGTKVADRPPMPEGMKLATVKGVGVVYYNPATGLVGKDFQGMDEATLGKLLNMSGTTKEDVLAAVGRGAKPAVVTVRRGETPVVDQATSTETLAQDAAAVAAKARPGDVVEVRTPEEVLAERQAPQRFPVRPSAPRTIRGEGTFITPEMRRAYAEEMTRVDAQGRRMLPDMSDAAVRAFYEARTADRRAAEAAAASEQARAARAAQQELDAQRQAAAEAEAPKAPVVAAPQKKGKAYQARVDNAQKIIEANQPSDVERAGFTSGATAGDRVKARTALLNRLDKIISQARAQKIAIPKRWKDGTPDYLGWLRAVADAKAGIEKGEATSTIIDRFLADEFYVSQGDFGAVKARRRGEAKGRFQKGEVREDQQREEAAMGGEEEPLGRVREATIEEEVSPTEIYEQSAIAEEEEKAPTYEQARERPTAKISENELLGEVVTQGRSKEGQFKVERKGAALRPKVEGKITLKPKAAAAAVETAKRAKTDEPLFLDEGAVPKGANVVYDTWESRQDKLDAVTPDGKKARKAFDDFDAYLENYSGVRSEAHNRAKEEFEFALRFSPDATVGEVLVGAYTNISAAALDADQTIRSKFAEFAAPVHSRMVDALRQYKYQIYKAIQNLKLTKEERGAIEAAVDAIDNAITKKTSAFDALKVNDVLREQAPKLREEFALLEAAIDYSQALIDAINGTPSLRLPDYKTGKPAVFDAFHGTREFFARFAKDRLGSFTKSPSAKEAFFFARNPATSNSYSGVNGDLPERVPDSNAALDAVSSHFVDGVVNPDMLALYDQLRESDQKIVDDIAQQLDEKRDTLSSTDKLARLRVIRQFLNNAVLPTPNTIMARVYLKNPLVADFQGRRYREQSYYELILEAKRNGHDGVIMLNTYDGGPQDVIYAVFNENQISDRFNPSRPEDQIFPLTPEARTELVNDYLWGNGGTNSEIVNAFTLRTSTVAEMTRAVKIADLVKSVISNKFGRVDQRLQRALAPQMLRALRQTVPNVEVRVIADEGFALIAPETALGLYLPGSDMIVLPERAFSDPKVFAWVIAHETAHAAFYKAVRSDAALRNQVVKLMEHVRSMSALTITRGEAFAKEAPIKYGFKNVDEFLAEAWSNPAFQRLLASTPIPTELATALGVRPAQRSMIRSLWDWLRFKVANVLGLPPNTLNAFDAVMRISEDLRRIGVEVRAEGAAVEGGPAFLEMPRVTQQTMQDLSTNLGGKVRRFKSSLKTMTMNARDMVDGLWKGTDAPLRAAKLRRAMDVMQADILARIGGDKLIEDHAALQRANRELYARMADLGYRYTVLDANPGGVEANKHMGNKRKYIQARGQLAELDAEFEKIRALNPQYTDLLVRTSNTFKSIQNDVALKEIKNILSKVGVDEPGLAERIHADGLTEADEAKFKTNATVQALKDARAFKKINGIYLPEMRRGDFVVNGRIDLEKQTPKTAIQLDQDTLLFTGNGDLKQAEKDASAFLKDTELTQTSAREIYVDKNDPLTELEKEDVDAVPALRVRVQTQFTSFVETEAEAKRLVDDMKADGTTLDARYQVKREAIGARSNVVSADMKRIESAMKRSEKFKDLSNGEQSTTLQALRELGLRLDGDGRLGHRRMYRRNVAGFSMDLLANTQTYLDQSAGYLARLEYQPKIDAAIDEMDRFMQERKDISTADAAKMREQYAVLVDRLYQVNLPQTGTANNIVRRVLQISMLNKLAGISYNIVNAHEPWLLGLPYLSGRFGVDQVVKSMGSAYRTLGVGGAVGRGIYDMARAFKQDRGFTNFQEYFVERYSATGADPEAVSRVSDLFSYLHETGLFDREAGMEVTRVNDPTSNVLGRGLDRAELMFRQVASTVEAINRAVVATAAYELEYKRTGNHEAAKNYAYDAVHDTMGDYSAINASPIFNHPVGRLALQFKKFAQKTYWLLGRTVAHMFKGDKEAMRQFAGLMFTTALVSGILGLPLEPIKIALLASGALLGTGFSYDDFEDLVRRTAAGMFGVKGGEVFTRGMYRMIDIEVANRMGLDSLLTFGQPRSQSQQDLKAWLFDTAGGAPAATIISQIASLNTLLGAKSNDDVLKALEQSMVPKAVVDITKAYRGYTMGKESASGRQTLEPYSLPEAAARAVGFTPAREYEQQRLRASVTDKDKQQQTERTKFNQQWYKAGPADRAKLWGQIEKWNKDRPKEARITRASLDAYVKRRNTEEESGSVVNGIRVNKNTRNFFEEGQRTYNVTR